MYCDSLRVDFLRQMHSSKYLVFLAANTLSFAQHGHAWWQKLIVLLYSCCIDGFVVFINNLHFIVFCESCYI